MDIKRINELKKVQEKQNIIEEMLYTLKTSSKAISLRLEFDNDEMEFYPTDKDGYEMEPNKQGLIIYLEHEVKHCENIKREIVREMALDMMDEDGSDIILNALNQKMRGEMVYNPDGEF